MKAAFRFRRGTAAQWILKNPILADGEPGYDTTSKRMKVGDGATPWMLLPYVRGESTDPGSGGVPLDLEDHVNSPTPHPVYDDMPSLVLVYQNAKV